MQRRRSNTVWLIRAQLFTLLRPVTEVGWSAPSGQNLSRFAESANGTYCRLPFRYVPDSLRGTIGIAGRVIPAESLRLSLRAIEKTMNDLPVSTVEPPARSRRWLRYFLAAALLLFVLPWLQVGLIVYDAHRLNTLVNSIRKMGGQPTLEDAHVVLPAGLVVGGADYMIWLHRRIDGTFLEKIDQRVKSITLKDAVIDDDLAVQVGQQPFLKQLDVQKCQLSSYAGEALASAPHLEELRFHNCRVTAPGPENNRFGSPQRLRRLFVFNTPIAGPSLVRLVSAPH